MRIALSTSSLASVGRAERSLSLLANARAEIGRGVTLLTFDEKRAAPAYPPHPSVEHRPLGLHWASSSPLMGSLPH
jgi:hypothetical protein